MCSSNLLTYLGSYANGILEGDRVGVPAPPSPRGRRFYSRFNARLGKHLRNELTLSRKICILVYASVCVCVCVLARMCECAYINARNCLFT